MDGLVAGAAVAFLLARRPQFVVPKLLVAISLPVLLEAFLVRVPNVLWDAAGLPIAEAAMVVLLLAALTLPTFAAVFSTHPLRFFGRISYSLYLWHYVLAWTWGLPHHAWAAAVLSTGIAYTSTRWLEEPLRARWRKQRPKGSHTRPSTVLTDA